MIRLLILFLLCIGCSMESPGIPVVSEAEAAQAQSDYLDWLESLPVDPYYPVHAIQEWDASLSFWDSTTKGEFEIQVTIRLDILDAGTARMNVDCRIGYEGEDLSDIMDVLPDHLQFEALVVDGDLWMTLELPEYDHLDLPFNSARLSTEQLTELYALERSASLAEVKNLLAKNPSLEAYSEWNESLWPEQASQAFHPVTTLGSFLHYFSCLRFLSEKDALHMLLVIDLEPGSYLRIILDSLREEFEADLEDIPDSEEVLAVLAVLPDHLTLALEVAPEDPTSWFLDIHCLMTPGDAGFPEEVGEIDFSMTIRNSSLDPPSDIPFWPTPEVQEEAMDLSFLAEMLMAESQTRLDAAESEQDIPF